MLWNPTLAVYNIWTKASFLFEWKRKKKREEKLGQRCRVPFDQSKL